MREEYREERKARCSVSTATAQALQCPAPGETLLSNRKDWRVRFRFGGGHLPRETLEAAHG